VEFIPLAAEVNLNHPQKAINPEPGVQITIKTDIRILFLSLIKYFQSIKAFLHHGDP